MVVRSAGHFIEKSFMMYEFLRDVLSSVAAAALISATTHLVRRFKKCNTYQTAIVAFFTALATAIAPIVLLFVKNTPLWYLAFVIATSVFGFFCMSFVFVSVLNMLKDSDQEIENRKSDGSSQNI